MATLRPQKKNLPKSSIFSKGLKHKTYNLSFIICSSKYLNNKKRRNTLLDFKSWNNPAQKTSFYRGLFKIVQEFIERKYLSTYTRDNIILSD